MSQDSKEWIKARMTILRKQSGFAFNQDLFISILLCLISGKDKHLVLTAPPNRLAEVTQMASQISRCLFGFTTAKMSCHKDQTRTDLVDTMFNTREDAEQSSDKLNTTQLKNKTHDQAIHSHKATRSIQTLDSRTSERSQTSRNKFLGDEEGPSPYTAPISPVDFNLKKRDRQPIMIRTRISSPAVSGPSGYPQSLRKDKTRWSDYTTSTRLAQTLIMQGLDNSNESIQALLLELIVTKELRISNVKYNVPKPHFLVIAVLPQGYNRLDISSQLMDRFFVSYNFEEDMFNSASILSSIGSRQRRFALVKNEEIKALTERSTQVHLNVDVTRYIRDIVVGIRTHPRVKGGLTARCSQDLVTVTKSLATLFERDYLTPDLVTIAAEKVFSHRLHILAINTRDDQMEKEDMDANLPADIVAEILRIIYVPI